jgi:signal peptidase I
VPSTLRLVVRSDVRPVRRLIFWLVLALAAAGFVSALAGLWPNLSRLATTSSVAMENTIRPGDRMFYVTASGLRRGDVVLERIPAPPGTPDLVVERVIALPGDHVGCYAIGGKVWVDGKPLDETYVYPGDAPSRIPFNVTLGRGQYWLLADQRYVALDSRQRGPVPRADIPWRVVAVLHGPSLTSLRTPRTFVALRLAPADTRPGLSSAWIAIVNVCALVLLIYVIFGIIKLIRFLARRRRRGAAAGPGQPAVVPSPR